MSLSETIAERTQRRDKPTLLDPAVADEHVEEFLALPMTYVPGAVIAERAWRYIRDLGISPPDSWYLACAVHYDAELWISHEHEDRLIQLAKRVHQKVHALTERHFAGA